MKLQSYTTFLYGALVLIGGIIGYLKAHSFPSLVTGTFFALLLFASAVSMLQNLLWGFYSAVVLSGILAGFFTYRFLLTDKFMPAGFMAILSVAVLVLLLLSKRQ